VRQSFPSSHRPTWFSSYTAIFKTLLGDILSLTGIACVASVTFYSTFLFTTMSFVLVVGCLGAGIVLATCGGRLKLRGLLAKSLAVFLLLAYPVRVYVWGAHFRGCP
jgi:hypothetical protein